MAQEPPARAARLDYAQNAINKTLVASFNARPAPEAPCRYWWEELDVADLRPDRSTIRTVVDRVSVRGATGLAPLIGRQEALPAL